MDLEFIKIGTEVLDKILPSGIPRTLLILLAGPGGVGKTFLTLSIAKQFLLKQEPVLYVSFDDDPLTIVSMLGEYNVDVYSCVKNRLLLVIDGFSFRIRDKKGKLHISVTEEVDPQNPEQVLYTIIHTVSEMDIRNRGLVVIDSLNELLTYHSYIKVSEFLKNIRANIAKYRGILTIAVLHTSSDRARRFLTLVEHIADGIILVEQTSKDGEVVRYATIKRMRGVKHGAEKVEFKISDDESKLLKQPIQHNI